MQSNNVAAASSKEEKEIDLSGLHSRAYNDPWSWWRGLGSPVHVCSPMVDQSELAYRMLLRKFYVSDNITDSDSQHIDDCYIGDNAVHIQDEKQSKRGLLCYTPMIHAEKFTSDKTYRKQRFATCDEERRLKGGLIAQFCANDPHILLNAAKLVEQHVDAVDLNLGCPENIARKGNYGSFLLRQNDLVVSMVQNVSQNLTVPITCKIRLLDLKSSDSNQRGLQGTINLCKELRAAGASLICIHGRTRDQKGFLTGSADWNSIKSITQYFKEQDNGQKFPLMANGGCETRYDVDQCLKITGCDAVMSAEALLEFPTLFNKPYLMHSFQHQYMAKPNAAAIAITACGDYDNQSKGLTSTGFALSYLDFAAEYPPSDFFKCVKAHCMKLVHRPMAIAQRVEKEIMETSAGGNADVGGGGGSFPTTASKANEATMVACKHSKNVYISAKEAREAVFVSSNEQELRTGLILLDNFMYQFYEEKISSSSNNEDIENGESSAFCPIHREEYYAYHIQPKDQEEEEEEEIGSHNAVVDQDSFCTCWRKDTWYRRHRQKGARRTASEDIHGVDNAAVERKRRLERKEKRKLNYRAMGFKV